MRNQQLLHFIQALERGAQDTQTLRRAMSVANPLNPFVPPPHELKLMSLWRCVCALHGILDSGVARTPELADSAVSACGSNEAANAKLGQMLDLYELAEPHLGGDLKSSSGETCLKFLREWLDTNHLGIAGDLLQAAPAATSNQGRNRERKKTANEHHGEAILCAIEEMGLDPMGLPGHGGRGRDPNNPKSAILARMLERSAITEDNFDHGWKHLKKEKLIGHKDF